MSIHLKTSMWTPLMLETEYDAYGMKRIAEAHNELLRERDKARVQMESLKLERNAFRDNVNTLNEMLRKVGDLGQSEIDAWATCEEENKKMRQALTTILNWRESDRCAQVLEFLEETARCALREQR